MAAIPEPQHPPRVAFGLYKRFLLGMLTIVASTSAAVATAALLQVKTAADLFGSTSKPIPGISGVLDNVDPGGPQTILVLGSDRRFVDIKAKAPTRSDTIILLRLDPSKGATAIMSLPRDLRVAIPGHGRDKINAAYAEGGPGLTVKTVRNLLGVSINHVVNVNFGGFQRAVNRLGCVYVDIDRRYFNDNNPPADEPSGQDYSVIDVPAGYQRLCGKAALEYVRFRHTDNDIVRGARQQDFLRQAKEQIGLGSLFSDRNELIRIVGRYTDTDINGSTAILRLLKLAVESAKNPIQEVHIANLRESGADLVASPAAIRTASRQLLGAQGTKGPRDSAPAAKPGAGARPAKRVKRARRNSRLPPGLFDERRAAEKQAIPLDAKLPFPVYYPKLARVGSTLLRSDHRAYDIFDRGRHRYRAYRMVINAPGTGQNYGVQGMSWTNPPILDNPSETRSIGGRKFQLYFDGDRLRLVAWRKPGAVYWVSNTLLQTLSNRQMLAIAGSLTRVGAR